MTLQNSSGVLKPYELKQVNQLKKFKIVFLKPF